MRHAIVGVLVVGLWLGNAGGLLLARGEWYDHYENAIEALERGEPERAVDLLQSAMSRKKRSGYFRTYGNNYVRYAPHYYLGVAHHDAGDCERALANFERSEVSQETAEVPTLASRLSSLRAACEARLQPPDTEIAEIVPALLEETPDPPHCAIAVATLESGLRSYLEGAVDESIRVFDELVREAPECSRLRLWLGMALHTAWVLEGRSDNAMLERSRAELAEARQLDPGLVLDPALYPPRLVALYRTLR